MTDTKRRWTVGLRLSDEVHARAAQLAAQEGLSLDEFITETLEAKLATPSSPPIGSPTVVPLMVSRILGRPARWAPAGSFLGGYEGADRTLQVFDTVTVDQTRFLEMLEPHRPELEQAAGGPLVVIFYSPEQSRRHIGPLLSDGGEGVDGRCSGPPGVELPDPTARIPASELEALFQHRDTWDKPSGKK